MQYAKVAEYQLRGVVHFHALIRLDGPRTADGFAPAPATIDAALLADLVRAAAASVRLTVPRRRRPGRPGPGARPSAASSTPARSAPAAAPTTPTAP